MHTLFCVFDFTSNELTLDQNIGPSWLDTAKCRSIFDFVYKPVRVKRNKSCSLQEVNILTYWKGENQNLTSSSKETCLKGTENTTHYSAVSCLVMSSLEN